MEATMEGRIMTKRFVAGALVVMLCQSAFAGFSGGEEGGGNATTIPPGQETTLFDPLPAQVRIKNLSSQAGEISLEGIPGTPLRSGQTVVGEFVLLDGTLRITSNIAQGEKRVRIRMGYNPTRVRSSGLRERSVRLMRLDARRARWQPAFRAIRNVGRVDIRRLQGRADFVLGHYGVDLLGRDAWGVVDVTSDYAVGALPIPEPLSLSCLAAGGVLLLLSHKRRWMSQRPS